MIQARAIAFPVMVLQLVLLTQLLVYVGSVDSTDHQHLFTDSFPKNDEYDVMALEPETPYGTPYGGFSRATASRLAGLPLKLPSISKEVQEINDDDVSTFEPMYTTVRDNVGRHYACRVYHEDELEADSLGDSMFDTPRLRKNSNSEHPSSSNHNQDTSEQQKESGAENIPVDSSKDEMYTTKSDVSERDGDEASTSSTAASTSSSKLSEMGFDPIMLGHTIHERLSKLTGLCAQVHPPFWWSYEWCHQDNIKQFHVKVTKSGEGKIHNVELEHITNLGSFSGREIQVAIQSRDDDVDEDNIDTLNEGRKELGRVVDTFVGGDNCPDTGKPRVTEATFRCCSKRNIARNKGGVLLNGNQIQTDIISVFQANEDKTLVCHYNITICTSLLCDDYDDGEGKSASVNEKSTPNPKSTEGSADKKSELNLELDPAKAEKMSVAGILEHTFGKREEFCIRSQTGGWWQYEFCPGDYVRQFHEEEADLMNQFNGIIGSQKKVAPTSVTEHFLGRYIPEDHEGVTKENEWEHVVNATTSTSTSTSSPSINSSPSASAGGNGAYYYQEYTNGDVCDQVDVTDSAMKAGEFGEGGIERAITVRYSCNSELTVFVKEDSTCHYVVDVTVPTLCHHPLFKAPVSKRQVVKCLPIA